ncbi:hypothetical protein LSAT2_006639 [Lamellibrachia satsuma]|nr:hypothetical protein LSAT2_006639 [Lamellibrachia satsuma]
MLRNDSVKSSSPLTEVAVGPVHSFTLSAQLFSCLPRLRPPSTVPRRISLERPVDLMTHRKHRSLLSNGRRDYIDSRLRRRYRDDWDNIPREVSVVNNELWFLVTREYSNRRYWLPRPRHRTTD